MVSYEEKERKQVFDYDIDIDMDIDVDIGRDSEGVSLYAKEKTLARAYIPFQKPGRLFHPEEALIKGTVYPELYSPYKPGGYSRHIV